MPTIGIISALECEARCLQPLAQDPEFVISVSGIGEEAAKNCAISLCKSQCTGIISFGYAGALNPIFRSGTLVIGTSTSNGIESIDLNSVWFDKLRSILEQDQLNNFEFTKLLTLNIPLTTREQKLEKYHNGGWGAVDMESYSIAEVANQHNVPVLVLRAILDDLNTKVPSSSTFLISPEGGLQTPKVLCEILKNPVDLFNYLILARSRLKANKSLSRVTPIISKCRYF